MGIGGEATNIARGPKRQEADFGTVEKVQKKKKKVVMEEMPPLLVVQNCNRMVLATIRNGGNNGRRDNLT